MPSPLDHLRVTERCNKVSFSCEACAKQVAPFAGRLCLSTETKKWGALHLQCVPPPPPPPKITSEMVVAKPKVELQVDEAVWNNALEFLPEYIVFEKDGQSYRKHKREVIKTFQAVGIDWLKKQRKSALLSDSPGLGKTLQSLAQTDPLSPLFIITTASTQLNWAREIRQWRPDIQSYCIKKREFRWPRMHEAVIISWSSLPRFSCENGVEQKIKDYREALNYIIVQLEQLYGPIAYNTTVLLDELQYAKNLRTFRGRTAGAIGSLARSFAGKTIGITGVPLENNPKDLYGVLTTLDLAKEIWPTYRDFVISFDGHKVDGKYVWGTPANEVKEYLQKVMINRLAEDHLTLPPMSFHEIEIPRSHLSDEILGQCDALIQWAGGLSSLEARLDHLGDSDMSQISSIRAAIAAALVPSVLAIARKFVENKIPVAVFSAHRAIIDVLSQEPGWVTIRGGDSPQSRYETVEAFQSGFLKPKGSNRLMPIGGVGFTTAGCEGITLVRAKVLIRASLDWTPGKNEQAVRRLSRIGQESPVEIVDIIMDHPLERFLHAALRRKELTLRAAGLELRSEVKVERIEIKGNDQ